MKLEIGQFVRLKSGYSDELGIGKISFIANCGVATIDFKNKKIGVFVEDIKKASYDTIDILEVGDYANGYYVSKIWEKDEITHYVNETPIKRKEREIVIQAPSYGGIEILKNKNIKSVITHEQMEQMAYKVEE